MPTILTCNQCNQTAGVGGRMKSTFLAYSQVNKLCYDKNQLEMCTMGGKMYWVGKNLKQEGKTLLGNEPIVLDLLRSDDDRICLRFDKNLLILKK